MLRFLTAGESHGPGLTTIVEGLPPVFPSTPKPLLPSWRDAASALGADPG